MSEGGDIAIDMAGGVATLKLRNPARRNAVTSAMWRAIHAFASEVGTRDDVRAVVIRGDGDKAFSAGADIADFEIARSGAANARAYDNLVEDSCQLIEAVAQPTVAVIVGPRSRPPRPPFARTCRAPPRVLPRPSGSTRRPMPAPTMPRAAAPLRKSERRASPAADPIIRD
jgi:Enoyl-CoA hydratase/isomerase